MCIFLLQNAALWDTGLGHCGICDMDRGRKVMTWTGDYIPQFYLDIIITHVLTLQGPFY